MQTICDAKLHIQDIVASWPGSSHDSQIFNSSLVRARFESGEMDDGLLLGGGGYGVRPYIITPLQNPETRCERLFNESQIRTRNVVERMYRVWKRRFPVLSLGMRVSLERVMHIIVATAVLHNIARDMHEEEPPQDPDVPVVNCEADQVPYIHPVGQQGGNNGVRHALIQDYFAR